MANSDDMLRRAREKREFAELQKELDEKYSEAKEAIQEAADAKEAVRESSQWTKAVELLEEIVAKDLNYKDAQAKLDEAKKRKLLAELYVRAIVLMQEKENWQEAHKLFKQILSMDSEYQNVAGLAEEAAQKLEEERQRSLKLRYEQALEFLDKGEERFREEGLSVWQSLRLRCEQTLALLGGSEEKLLEKGLSMLEKIQNEEPDYEDVKKHIVQTEEKIREVKEQRQRLKIALPIIGVVVALVCVMGVITIGVGVSLLFTPTPTPVAAVTDTPTTTTYTPPPLKPTDTPAPKPSVVTTTNTPTSEAPTATPTNIPTPEPPVVTTINTPTPAPPTPTPTPTAALTGHIVFPLWDPQRETLDIYIANVDGSNRRRLVEEASQPDVSLDGQMIAYRSWAGSERGLIVQGLDGSQRQRLTNGLEDADPRWYPDEQRIIYHSRKEIDRHERIYDVGTWAGATPTVWRQGTETIFGDAPTWLGRDRIVYNQCLAGGCSPRIMNRNGSGNAVLLSDFNGGRLVPAGSPLGTAVAFAAQKAGNWDIYLLDVTSGQTRRVTNDPADDVLPAWVPDGRRLLFVTNRGGEWAVWAMNADGSGQQQLFALGGSLEGAFPREDTYMGWIEERIAWAP